MVSATAKRRGRTLRLALIAMFVALIAVGAFIKVPIGIVPVSLQMAFALLSALLLGPADSLIAVLIYLLMGLVGIPIFTAGGGIFYVLQPTFGYLLGYVFALPVAGVIARGARCDARPNYARMLLGALAGMAIVYTFGVTYMYLMLNFYLAKPISLKSAWLTGAAVFLPTDITWCVIGAAVARRIVPRLYGMSVTTKGISKPLLYEEYQREDNREKGTL